MTPQTDPAVLAAVGHCVWCAKPVYGVQADSERPAHACCEFWMGVVGFTRCYACRPCAPARVPDAPRGRPSCAQEPGTAAGAPTAMQGALVEPAAPGGAR